MTSARIAQKRGITARAVNKRRAALRSEMTAVAVVAEPESRRLVQSELDAIAVLNESMRWLLMLSDAYHDFLLAFDDPTKYDIGPMSTEIDVTYWDIDADGKSIKANTTLQELLDRIANRFDHTAVKWRSTDPRSELRATVTTINTTVNSMVELAQLLTDMRSMEALRDELLAAIGEADPEIAQRVALAVRSRLVFHCRAPS